MQTGFCQFQCFFSFAHFLPPFINSWHFAVDFVTNTLIYTFIVFLYVNIKTLGLIGLRFVFADALVYYAAKNLNDINIGVIENTAKSAFKLIPLSAIIGSKLVKFSREEMIVNVLLPFRSIWISNRSNHVKGVAVLVLRKGYEFNSVEKNSPVMRKFSFKSVCLEL